MVEWPCCHDPLRSSPASHGFVPPSPPNSLPSTLTRLKATVERSKYPTGCIQLRSAFDSMRCPSAAALSNARAAARGDRVPAFDSMWRKQSRSCHCTGRCIVTTSFDSLMTERSLPSLTNSPASQLSSPHLTSPHQYTVGFGFRQYNDPNQAS